MTQVPRWAASSKAVPTSTTTGVLWSQVSAALYPRVSTQRRGSKVQSHNLVHVCRDNVHVGLSFSLKASIRLIYFECCPAMLLVCLSLDSVVFAEQCTC